MKKKIKNALRNTKYAFSRIMMRIIALFFPVEKKIVFMSFLGNQYSDNPRAISEKMHELYPDYKIIWVLSSEASRALVPTYVRLIGRGIYRYFHIVTSFCYVTNTNNDPDLYKRDNQLFIQTWHGDGGFKKILYSNPQGRTESVPVADNTITDICMAGSVYGEEKYRTAFRYHGKILSVGCARNDKLINPDPKEIHTIKKRLSIEEDYKILLYAPTFRRENRNKQTIPFDIDEILFHLSKHDNERWICMIRSHPSATFSKTINMTENTIDVSRYPDMADLLLVSDFLITDYSSCACDFALTHKPVILVTFDIFEYTQNERKMNINIDDTGFITAGSQFELLKIIDNYTMDDYKKSSENVLNYYGSKETGKASETICNIINESYHDKGLGVFYDE